MEYLEFERILSAKRIQRYKDAANGDTRKAMALYRYNLRLSQEMFTIVSCFEVALRNAIDSLLVPSLGEDWLKDSVQDNGIFSNGRMNETRKIIEKAYNRLNRQEVFFFWKISWSFGNYNPPKQQLFRWFWGIMIDFAVRLFSSCFPQSVQIAVLSGTQTFFVSGECCLGLASGLQFVPQHRLGCQQLNPLDIVLVEHRMLHTPHSYVVSIGSFLNHRYMFLLCSVGRVLFEQYHRFAAAHQFACSMIQHFHDVATNGATIDFPKFCHNVSFLLECNVALMFSCCKYNK